MSLILIERTLNIKKQSWGCTGFDARPARTMGKPSEAKQARWSRASGVVLREQYEQAGERSRLHPTNKTILGMYWF